MQVEVNGTQLWFELAALIVRVAQPDVDVRSLGRSYPAALRHIAVAVGAPFGRSSLRVTRNLCRS